MSYKLIDHTADTGLDLEAEVLPELFADAAKGMYEVLGLRDVEAHETRTLQLEPAPLDLLLVDWLREILALHDSEEFLTGSVDIHEIHEDQVFKAELHGERYDPDRHHPETEIKGVTYHGLYVEEKEDLWKARVIFDL